MSAWRAIPVAASLFLTAASPVETPGPRLGHALAYDASRQRIVLLDGARVATDHSAVTDVWIWDGGEWRRVSTPGPQARDMGATAFDTRRNRLVSYGGRIGSQGKSDLWEWDGRVWTQASDTTPGARFHHAMAYDAARGRTVMYGGATNDRWDTDTWEWDGARWAKLSVPGPGPRAAFRMVYDETRRQIVLFGGVGAPSNDGKPQRYYNDTWAWDGAEWRKVSDGGPPPRRDPSMAFDAGAGVVLLYGGGAKDGQADVRLTDMWRWDGARWSQIALGVPNPGHRYVSAMAYDAARRRTVLYGGYGCEREATGCGVLADTWEWDGTRWEKKP